MPTRLTLPAWTTRFGPGAVMPDCPSPMVLVVDRMDEGFSRKTSRYIIQDGPADVAYGTAEFAPNQHVKFAGDAYTLVSRSGDWLFYKGQPDAVLRLAGESNASALNAEEAILWRSIRFPAPLTTLPELLASGMPPLWSIRGREEAAVAAVKDAVLGGRVASDDRPPGFDRVIPSPVRKLNLLWRTWAWPGQLPGQAQRARVPWYKLTPRAGFFGSLQHSVWERLGVAYIELVEIEGLAVLRFTPFEVHETISADLARWLTRAAADLPEAEFDWFEGVNENDVVASYVPAWLAFARGLEAMGDLPGVKRAAARSQRLIERVAYRGG